jgi:exosortase/archaeosortase family protein
LFPMKKQDYVMLAVLAALAAFVWLRDLRWWDEAGDSLPILAALPIFFFLRRPWRWREEAWRLATAPAITAAILFPLGIAVDSGLVLAVAWTVLLWSWISARTVELPGQHTRQLLVLPLLAFPWILTDMERLAWWFRLSGASASADVLSFAGFHVVREGTYLWANDFAVSVEPACSGVNGLQSMLVAGAAIAYVKLKGSSLFWWNLPVLAGAAWLANLLRILTATSCGALMTPEAAERWVDPVHSFAGWLALCAGFIVCYFLFSVQERALAEHRAGRRSWFAGKPWLELTLLAYAGWCASGLVATWIWTPFDRLGWLAFAVWLLPLVAPARDAVGRMPPWTRIGALAVGLGALLAGNVADVNFFYHVGLAAILTSFNRRRGYLLWAMGAVAWLPASGWFASRAGIDPSTFAFIRVFLASVATAWGLGLFSWARRSSGSAQPIPVESALVAGKARHAR